MDRKKIVIIGCGGHSNNLIEIISSTKEYEIAGYVDISKKDIPLKYLGSDDDLPRIRKKISNAIVGIGQVKWSNKRKKIFKKLKNLKFNLPVIKAATAKISNSAEIGEGTIIMDNTFIGAKTKIGKYCIINTGSIVEHNCAIGDYVHISINATVSGEIKIEKESMIGAGATLIQCVSIGGKVIIAAGATVINDCIEPGIYTGIPARLKKHII